MPEAGQGEIANPHGIEGIYAHQDDNDNEVNIAGAGPLNDCKEGEDAGR